MEQHLWGKERGEKALLFPSFPSPEKLYYEKFNLKNQKNPELNQNIEVQHNLIYPHDFQVLFHSKPMKTQGWYMTPWGCGKWQGQREANMSEAHFSRYRWPSYGSWVTHSRGVCEQRGDAAEKKAKKACRTWQKTCWVAAGPLHSHALTQCSWAFIMRL